MAFKKVNRTAAVPFLKKITPKTVTEQIGIDLLNLPRPVKGMVLYDLFGVITGVKTGSTTIGPWIKFLGRFQAVTPADADGVVQRFESGATHIPMLEDLIHGTLVAKIAEAEENDAPRPRFEIAYRVAIVPAREGKPSATGYEFDVQRLIPEQMQQDDPLLRLQAEAAKVNAALPAPSTSAATIPASGTESAPNPDSGTSAEASTSASGKGNRRHSAAA